MNWQRARTDDQKQTRKSQIVQAAEDLFDTQDYSSITLADIARKSDFTRSNLYKYFKTREEIFFLLILQNIKEWQQELLNSSEFKRGCTIDIFAQIITESLIKNKRTLQFISLLNSDIKKHIEKENPLYFLNSMKEIYDIFSELITILFHEIDKNQALEFAQAMFAIAGGMYQVSIKNWLPKDISNSENRIYQFDFKKQFTIAIKCYLKSF